MPPPCEYYKVFSEIDGIGEKWESSRKSILEQINNVASRASRIDDLNDRFRKKAADIFKRLLMKKSKALLTDKKKETDLKGGDDEDNGNQRRDDGEKRLSFMDEVLKIIEEKGKEKLLKK